MTSTASPAMPSITRVLALVLAVETGFLVAVRADEKKPYTGATCTAPVDDFFKDEVWAKVGVTKCLTCHKPGGDAEDSKFVLQDPRRAEGAAQTAALRHNR